MSDPLTKDDAETLRHIVGAVSNIPRRDWGFRNYFACSKGDEPQLEKLRALGLVVRGRKYEDSYYYHATETGCAFAGLSAKQTHRALLDD